MMEQSSMEGQPLTIRHIFASNLYKIRGVHQADFDTASFLLRTRLWKSILGDEIGFQTKRRHRKEGIRKLIITDHVCVVLWDICRSNNVRGVWIGRLNMFEFVWLFEKKKEHPRTRLRSSLYGEREVVCGVLRWIICTYLIVYICLYKFDCICERCKIQSTMIVYERCVIFHVWMVGIQDDWIHIRFLSRWLLGMYDCIKVVCSRRRFKSQYTIAIL